MGLLPAFGIMFTQSFVPRFDVTPECVRLPQSGAMNKGHHAISYQPEPSDLHQIIHELANVMQRCLALRMAVGESPKASEEDVVKLRESVQYACGLVHRIAERVENLPCARCAERRPIRSQRF